MKIIIISKQAQSWITLPEKRDYNIIPASDIPQKLDKILSIDKNYPVKAIFFIKHEEYLQLNKYLNIVPFQKIYYQIIIIGTEKNLPSKDLTRLYHISEYRINKITAAEYVFIVNKSFSLINEFYKTQDLKNKYMSILIETHQDKEDLISIGKSISSEKDPDKLLRLILFLSKKITGADAGSIYIVEKDDKGARKLRFKYSHNFSRDDEFEEFVIDIDQTSIAGYVAVTGEVLNIPDAYQISKLEPYSFNSYFDRTNNYISRSMLVVPMRNHFNEIIGVIQLINCKRDQSNQEETDKAFKTKLIDKEDFDKYVVTFDKKYDNLLEGIAGQAAVSLENNKLIEHI
jgi:hypothetical protein